MSTLTRTMDFLLARNRSAVDKKLDDIIKERFGTSRSVSVEDALKIPAMFQSMNVIVNALAHTRPMAFDSTGARVLENDSRFPALLRSPNPFMTWDTFVHLLATSLFVDGNAFYRKVLKGTVVESMMPLNPTDVEIVETQGGVSTKFKVNGQVLDRKQITHIPLELVLGQGARGLGPIQKGQGLLHGARMVQQYIDNWFDDAHIPNGWLNSDKPLTEEQAQFWREQWKKTQRNHDIAVLGQGLKYETNQLNPKDSMFVEIQQWYRQEICVLTGVSPSLLLTGASGAGGLNYTNASTEWLQMMRFGLHRYVRGIETAISNDLPGKQKMKLNTEALYRGDPKSRADLYQILVKLGITTPDEARELEDKEGITDAELKNLTDVFKAVGGGKSADTSATDSTNKDAA